MERIHFRRHLSRNVLFRMVLLALAGTALVAWKLDLVRQVYFEDQLTPVGLAINAAIVALFLLGVLKLTGSFIGYMREEGALVRFLRNLEKEASDPMRGVSRRSLIGRRFAALVALHANRTPINQGALAATLVASESTRTSFPKFINNILILTGVFGTIVSLSIALLGASDLLENTVDVGGMGMVVHGMSAALSTTITAIVCYLYFGYFYLKLTDVQTNLVSSVEEVTTHFLMPRFQVHTDSVLYEFSGLIRSLQSLVSQMEKSQAVFEQVDKHLLNTLDTYRGKVQSLSEDMFEIRRLLRSGFRLPESE